MCNSGHKAGCLCCLQLKFIKGKQRKQRKDLPMPSSLNWRKTLSTVRNGILPLRYFCPEEEKESSVITQTTEQDMWLSFSSSPLDAGPEKEPVPKGYKAYLKPAFLPAPCWLPGGLVSHCCSQVWRLLRRLSSLSFLFLSEGRWARQLSGRSELFLSDAICQHSFHTDYELICPICLHSVSPVSYKGESIKSC